MREERMVYIVKSYSKHEFRSLLTDDLEDPPGWRASASCAGMDPTLFDLPDNHKADDLDKLKDVARLVCSGCPVKAECLEGADDVDLKYTIRGGIVPGKGTSRGRPRLPTSALKKKRNPKGVRTKKQHDALIDEAIAQKYMLNKYCRKGHELTRENVYVRTHSRGGRQGYCATCHKLRNERKRVQWCRDNLSS